MKIKSPLLSMLVLACSLTAFGQILKDASLPLISSHTTQPLSLGALASGDYSKALSWWDDCISAHKAAGIPYLVMSYSQPLNSKAELENANY